MDAVSSDLDKMEAVGAAGGVSSSLEILVSANGMVVDGESVGIIDSSNNGVCGISSTREGVEESHSSSAVSTCGILLLRSVFTAAIPEEGSTELCTLLSSSKSLFSSVFASGRLSIVLFDASSTISEVSFALLVAEGSTGVGAGGIGSWVIVVCVYIDRGAPAM